MSILALVSRWLLGGGWKIASLAVLAVAAGLFVLRVAQWKSGAAKVPLLTAQIADSEKRAGVVLARLSEAEQKRSAAEAALSAWQSFKSVTLDSVKGNGRHAPASTNAVCAPSALDRSLRNDAIRKLLGAGETGSAGGMPDASGAAY